MKPSTATSLAEAISRIEQDDFSAARGHLRRIVEEGIDHPSEALALASLLFVTRDYHESLCALDRAAALGAGPTALWQKQQDALRLGWELDARDALLQGARLEPQAPRWQVALFSLHARRRDQRRALHHGALLLKLAPRSPAVLIEMASIHVTRGERARAVQFLDLSRRLPLSGAARLEGIRLLRAAGAFDRARMELQELLGGPLATEARGMLAELALWSGDTHRAEELANAGLPPLATRRVQGICAALRGRLEEASKHFEAVLEEAPDDHEALTWKADLCSEQGDHETVRSLLTRALMSARGQHLIATLLWMLNDLRAGPIPKILPPSLTDQLLPVLVPRCPEDEVALRNGEPGAWRRVLERCRKHLQGNRSSVATWTIGGKLEPLPFCLEPRVESRRILERIRVSPCDELLEELEALALRFPRSGLPHAHRGELLLWLGASDAARRALEQATEATEQTRWAYIGLTMCDLLEGNPEQALRTSARGVAIMSNTEGPAVYVHRGEALRLLGRHEEARADLERSVAMHPSRVGAWLNLALLNLEDRFPESVRAAHRIEQLAPGLLSEAARAGSCELFLGRDRLNEAVLGQVLRRALAMTQGNRSSGLCSYRSPDGALRFGLHGGHTREPLHGDARQRIDLARTLLRQASRAPGEDAG